jgi:hypothetical protein
MDTRLEINYADHQEILEQLSVFYRDSEQFRDFCVTCRWHLINGSVLEIGRISGDILGIPTDLIMSYMAHSMTPEEVEEFWKSREDAKAGDSEDGKTN